MVVPDLFVHFTTLEAAQAIASSLTLNLSRTIFGAVYAAPVGGEDAPDVQHACLDDQGEPLDPDGSVAAVVFVPSVDPDEVYPVEAIWNRLEPLPLVEVLVVSAGEGRALLDGSAGIDDEWAWD